MYIIFEVVMIEELFYGLYVSLEVYNIYGIVNLEGWGFIIII